MVNNSTTYENSHSFGGENSLTYFAGAELDVENCGGVGVMICTSALDVDNENDLTMSTEYSYEDAIANTYSQELSFEQSISTSGDDDYGDLGYNQDVFYGTTQNVMAQKPGRIQFLGFHIHRLFCCVGCSPDGRGLNGRAGLGVACVGGL